MLVLDKTEAFNVSFKTPLTHTNQKLSCEDVCVSLLVFPLQCVSLLHLYCTSLSHVINTICLHGCQQICSRAAGLWDPFKEMADRKWEEGFSPVC